jgi:hypothetical protein
VFVGDAIYLCNRSSFTSANQHYYDPRQIYRGQSPLKKRRNYKDVEVGDIVVFGDYHMEIITQLRKNYWIADDGFCSIGAGRADNPTNKEGDGKPRCDTAFSFALGDTREIGDKNNSYYYI